MIFIYRYTLELKCSTSELKIKTLPGNGFFPGQGVMRTYQVLAAQTLAGLFHHLVRW